MGMISRPAWSITLTHIPTEISVQTDSSCFRKERDGLESLKSRLKSKLYMIDKMKLNEEDLIIEYDDTSSEEHLKIK